MAHSFVSSHSFWTCQFKTKDI